MAHLVSEAPYQALVERLNRAPQGAPPSEVLYKILAMLFSEREAALVAELPIKPFTAKGAARIWKLDLAEARKVLDGLADRAILVDVEWRGESAYSLPPPMAGFFEFSLMRLRDDLDQKVLAELFHQYLNVEDQFIKELFTGGETSLGRVFVQEQALPSLGPEPKLNVLDYERASEVIETASHIGVSMCYCRHKMEHMGRACDAPMDICMTFNTTGASLTKHGYAREIDRSECHELLHQAQEANLVQFGENIQRGVSFICNCCGCCCEAMLAVQRFGMVHPIHTNFIAAVDEDLCIGCEACAGVCPIHAVAMDELDVAEIDQQLCLGCGVCVRSCPTEALELESRPERVLTPVDSTHRAVVMAIERGKLQNLIFDNHALRSHRAMAAILGVILKLPPVKRAMASKQMKSRYLEALLTRLKPGGAA